MPGASSHFHSVFFHPPFLLMPPILGSREQRKVVNFFSFQKTSYIENTTRTRKNSACDRQKKRNEKKRLFSNIKKMKPIEVWLLVKNFFFPSSFRCRFSIPSNSEAKRTQKIQKFDASAQRTIRNIETPEKIERGGFAHCGDDFT